MGQNTVSLSANRILNDGTSNQQQEQKGSETSDESPQYTVTPTKDKDSRGKTDQCPKKDYCGNTDKSGNYF